MSGETENPQTREISRVGKGILPDAVVYNDLELESLTEPESPERLS